MVLLNFPNGTRTGLESFYTAHALRCTTLFQRSAKFLRLFCELYEFILTKHSSLFSGVALVTLDGDVVFGNSLVAAQEIENSSLFALV